MHSCDKTHRAGSPTWPTSQRNSLFQIEKIAAFVCGEVSAIFSPHTLSLIHPFCLSRQTGFPCAFFFRCGAHSRLRAALWPSRGLCWLTCRDSAERGQLALEQGHVLVLNATTLATEVRRALSLLHKKTKQHNLPILSRRREESTSMTSMLHDTCNSRTQARISQPQLTRPSSSCSGIPIFL